MRLARIEMIFQREEEIALKVLKYSTGTMRRWGINTGEITEPPGRRQARSLVGARRAGSAAGPWGAESRGGLRGRAASPGHARSTEGLWPPRAHRHQGLVATKGSLLLPASPATSAELRPAGGSAACPRGTPPPGQLSPQHRLRPQLRSSNCFSLFLGGPDWQTDIFWRGRRMACSLRRYVTDAVILIQP